MADQHANENDRLRALSAKWRADEACSATEYLERLACADELDAAILALSAREAAPDAVVELRRLYRAYVRLLESGMDRIHGLGGKCDPVDYMERNDPDLIKTRRFLATQPPADQRQEGCDCVELRAMNAQLRGCVEELAAGKFAAPASGDGLAVAWLYEASNGCDPEVWATFASTYPPHDRTEVRNIRPLYTPPPAPAGAVLDDAKRLDFMARHGFAVRRLGDSQLWMVLDGTGDPVTGGEHDTARDAIDEAVFFAQTAQSDQGAAS